MWLDAFLAYLHFSAIFILFAFLSVQVYLVRLRLDATTIRQLARVDLWYAGSALVVLATGLARAFWGAKGAAFYLDDWAFYAKVALFLGVGLVSIRPTLAFRRWKRAYEADPSWSVPEAERNAIRGWLMLEIHLASIIPVFAVVMARGLSRSG
jgi:putative membrane protein